MIPSLDRMSREKLNYKLPGLARGSRELPRLENPNENCQREIRVWIVQMSA